MKRFTLSSYLLLISSLVLLAGTTYLTYGVERNDTAPLLVGYSLTFVAYLVSCRLAQAPQHVKRLLIVAVVARAVLLPAMPNLSDDLYRFVWDGRLLAQGYDPFAYRPSEIMQGAGNVAADGIDQALFEQLNSPEYYTIYPPVNQAVFALAAWLSPTSVRGSAIVIRLVIFAAELLTLWLLTRLLNTEHRTSSTEYRRKEDTSSAGRPRLITHYSLLDIFRQNQHNKTPTPYHPPARHILLYALNPLVIVELTGNLHFEALMITFVLGSVYLLRRHRLVLSGVAMALAVCTKLVPLILLPLYLRRLGGKKALLFYGVVGLASAALFFPLVTPELIAGMRDSVGLYFQKFEFNASIYYLIRANGYYRKGYNIIAQAGRWLAIATFVSILLYALLERAKHLPTSYGWVWLIFLLLSTTVHPWYVIPLVAYAVFTPYRYAVLWSGLIFFSYAGYTAGGFSENLWITGVEYGAVLGTLGYEVVRQRRRVGKERGGGRPEA